jgi:hypothetical protein
LHRMDPGNCYRCRILAPTIAGDELWQSMPSMKLEDLVELVRGTDVTISPRCQSMLECAAVYGRVDILSHLLRSSRVISFITIFPHAAAHSQLGSMSALAAWKSTPVGCIQETYPGIRHGMLVAARYGHLSAMELVRDHLLADDHYAYHRALISAGVGGHSVAIRLLVKWGANFGDAVSEMDRAAAKGQISPKGVCNLNRTRESLIQWQRKIAREQHHAVLLDYAIVLRPLALPTYPLLWVLEYAAPGPLTELERVRLLERVQESRV